MGFDGLRGLAVAFVVVAHSLALGNQSVLGVVGVDVFLVLSGYLITRLLLAEREERDGSIFPPSGSGAPAGSPHRDDSRREPPTRARLVLRRQARGLSPAGESLSGAVGAAPLLEE